MRDGSTVERGKPIKMLLLPALLLPAALLLPGGALLRAPPSPRHPPPRAARGFEPRELVVGGQWEGLISKVTDYGFFVRMGHEQHMGLVHIRTLASERLPREDVSGWIEETVGPVGSKVQVEVQRLKFKGEKRTSLKLLDVITRQNMENVVFAAGPRRRSGGYDDHNDGEEGEAA